MSTSFKPKVWVPGDWNAFDNVESAAVAGDSFPTTRVLTADGVVSLIG